MMTNINIDNKRSAFLNLQEKLKDIPDDGIMFDEQISRSGNGLNNLHQYERLNWRKNLQTQIDEELRRLVDPDNLPEENTATSLINVLLRDFEGEINKCCDKQRSDLIEENEEKADRYRASITMPVEPNSARTLSSSSSSSLEQSVTPVRPTQSIFSFIASLAQSAVAAIKSMASRTILWNIQTNDEKGLPVFKGKVDDLDTYFQKEAEIHFQKFMVQKKESIFLGLGQQLVDHFHVSCGDGVLYSGSKKQIETRLAEAYQTAISEQQPTQAKLIDETRQDFQSITGKKKTSELFKEKFKESINPAQELSDEEDKWRGPGHPRD